MISRALMEDYENSRSSPGLAVDCLHRNSSDGERSALSSWIGTTDAFLHSDKMMDSFAPHSRYGMTFVPLTADRGEAVLTWCREVSRARTSAFAERPLESKGSEADSGATWPGSLAKFDPASRSWKTAQLSLFEESGVSLETFPRWAMWGRMGLLALDISEDRWNASGFGLPAPTKCMGKRGWGIAAKPRYSAELEANARLFGYKPHPSVLEWAMGWIPTWTRLEPLATAKFQSWRQAHGKFLRRG